MRAILVLAIATFVAPMGAAQSLPPRSDLAITHATVIDVQTGERRGDQTILIVGNRIQRIGATASVRVGPGLQVVDATGKFVIPGLWDMHVHTVRHDLDFPMEIANGVTGVRDMGGSVPYPPPGNWGIHFDSLRAWRASIRAGTMVGPRIVAGGIALDGPEPIWPQPLSLKTAAEARRVVDSLAAEGVDFIKVYGRLPRDFLVAIADQARTVGLPFAGHLSSFMTIEESAALGHRSMEHVNALEASFLDAEAMQSSRRAADLRASTSGSAAPLPPAERARQMRQVLATFDSARLAQAATALAGTKMWSDPTLVALRSLALPLEALQLDTMRLAAYTPRQIREVWSARLAGMAPPGMAPVLAERLGLWEHAVRAIARAGARILVGSDAWNPYVMPGFGLHREMELLVLQGIPPLTVLRAATLGAAQYLELSDSLGTIAAGKLADLVVLDGDPLSDISNAQQVHAVVLDGRLFTRRELDALLAKARASAGGK